MKLYRWRIWLKNSWQRVGKLVYRQYYLYSLFLQKLDYRLKYDSKELVDRDTLNSVIIETELIKYNI